MEHKLSKDEIAYFYELLYKYEYDSHGGYQDKKVKSLICGDLVLDDNHKDGENICSKKKNILQFTPFGKTNCWAILNHTRNAFAHGNIQSVDGDTSFLIQDYSDKSKRQICNMLALVEKDKFYKLIEVINDTRKKTIKRNKTTKSKKTKK